MSHYYQLDQLLFYPQYNEIHRADEKLKLRPKTAELLEELLKANGEIVSKDQLLETVWSDVVVEEHVVFQSIAELRKILGENSVIKTHPRKGYSITSSIKAYDETAPIPDINLDVAPENTKKSRLHSRYVLLLVFLLLITIVIGFYNFFPKKENDANFKGSIIVLPVSNYVEDSTYRWISYGGMDLLIKYLQPELDAPVLPTEVVLDTLGRANLNSQDINEKSISRLFEVSGAEIIIEQTLSGYSRDYQLVYSIHQKNKTKRGVLFAEDTGSLFFDLSALLLRSMGIAEKRENQTYQHEFANEMMASAIDEMQSENYEKSATMFKAVLVTEPQNLLANRMLAKSLVYNGDYQEAERVAASAADLARLNDDNKSLGRMLFWQALSITQQQGYSKALSLLQESKTKSKQTNDLLYLANASRVAGKIYLKQKQFELSRQATNEALSFYQAIQEPYGQSSTHIDLGELAYAMRNWTDAKIAFEKALNIATKSQLKQLIEQAKAWLEKVKAAEAE